MSKLDKETVLAEYEAAYQKAHGKKPKIEAKSGWYSVDGGKNVRLAQLAEEAKELAGGTSASAQTTSKSAEKKTPAKKSASTSKSKAKSSTSKKSSSKAAASQKPKTTSSGNGLTAKELWKQKLEQKGNANRLPRGSF